HVTGYQTGALPIFVGQQADRGRLGQVRIQPVQGEQGPPAVHARVPVEAAEEERVQGARALHVAGAAHHVVQLVRVLAGHVAERGAGVQAGDLGGQARAHAQNLKASRYIRAMLTSSSTPAVGSWARMTPLNGASRSGRSSRAAGTTLKLAAIGVVRVPQKPDSMPMAPTMAGLPPNCSTTSRRPTAAVITGKAAKALPMMKVNIAMPRQ